MLPYKAGHGTGGMAGATLTLNTSPLPVSLPLRPVGREPYTHDPRESVYTDGGDFPSTSNSFP